MTGGLLRADQARGQTAANGGLAHRRRADGARRLAHKLHGGDGARAGDSELLAHVGRVVAMVPRDVEPVAWLHEALEHAGSSASELRCAGLDPDQIAAVRLLTRSARTDSDEAYLRHLAAIANAPGNAGRIARIVKVADLNDRLSHPRTRPDGWCPPYADGFAVLQRAHSESGLSHQPDSA